MTRYVRFWMTGPMTDPLTGEDRLTGLRGQCGMSGDDDVQLYDIVQDGDEWVCLRWIHLETDPDAIAKKEIARGDCFACMVAAELHAKHMDELEAEDE